MAERNFAISLFALLDRRKIDLSKPLPDELAEHLQQYLANQLKIQCLSCKFITGGEEPLLVMHDVSEESLPPLCSLVDVQRAQLFRYERNGEDQVTLTPLNVKID